MLCNTWQSNNVSNLNWGIYNSWSRSYHVQLSLLHWTISQANNVQFWVMYSQWHSSKWMAASARKIENSQWSVTSHPDLNVNPNEAYKWKAEALYTNNTNHLNVTTVGIWKFCFYNQLNETLFMERFSLNISIMWLRLKCLLQCEPIWCLSVKAKLEPAQYPNH